MDVDVDEEAEESTPEPAAGRRRARRRPRFLSWLGRALFVVVAIAVLTPLTVGFRVWYEARQDHHPKSDAIIVLGAAQYDGKPSPYLKARLEHAYELYKEGVAPVIITVGGKQMGDRTTEAASGKVYLMNADHKVPAGSLIALETGSDTLTSMVAVGREYRAKGWKTGVVVTDPWHSLRSDKMASDNGIRAVSSPTRSGPSVQTRDTQFSSIVRETGGYLYYVLLGRSRGKM
ncbi:YdcF family protein [Actinocorallia longicatena]